MKILNLRNILKIHRWLGLWLAANLLIFSVTGIVLIWKDEIAEFGQLKYTDQKNEKNNFAIEASNVLSEIQKKFPEKKVLAIFKDDKDQNRINVRLTDLDKNKFRGSLKYSYFISDKRLVANSTLENRRTNLVSFLLDLHKEMLLGAYGKYLVGLIGIFISASILSGVYYASKTKQIISKSLRFRLAVIHAKLGLFIFPWLFLITLTGIILAFNGLIITAYFKNIVTQTNSEQNVILEKRIITPTKLTQAIEKAHGLNSKFEVDYISFPGNEFSLNDSFVFLMEEKEEYGGSVKLAFSSIEKEYSALVSLPFYLEWLILSEVIHFGHFAGLPSKIFWTILSIFTLVIPVSGFLIFVLRTRKNSFKGYLYAS